MSSTTVQQASRVRKQIRSRPRKHIKKSAVPDQWLLNFDFDITARSPVPLVLDCPPTVRSRTNSPIMSYPYSSGEQPSYGYTAFPVPQYTESQISNYYQQYQCYPPQPYHVIPDFYPTQQMVLPSSHHSRGSGSEHAYYGDRSNYDSTSTPSGYTLAPPEDPLRRHGSQRTNRKSRSPSPRPRTWTCDFPNCSSTANFTRLADLQRHQATVHGMGTPDFPCTVPRCTRVGDKGFTRRDHLVEHLRNFHHLDIPKRRPGERSANPLGIPNFQQHEQ